jgi:hypothetical protein
MFNAGIITSVLRPTTTARTVLASLPWEQRVEIEANIASRRCRENFLMEEAIKTSDKEIEEFLAAEAAKEVARKESYRLSHLPPTRKHGNKKATKPVADRGVKPQDLIEAEKETRRLERLVLQKVREDRAAEEKRAREEVARKAREEQLAKERAARAAALEKQRQEDFLREAARKERLAAEKRQADLKTRRELEQAQALLRGEAEDLGLNLSQAPLAGTPRPTRKEIARSRWEERKYTDQARVQKALDQQKAYQAKLLAQLGR